MLLDPLGQKGFPRRNLQRESKKEHSTSYARLGGLGKTKAMLSQGGPG